MRFLGCRTEDIPEAKRGSVLVIGAGPAGLGAAGRLVCMGHEVVVVDKMPEPGGLLIFGIPEFRVRKDRVRAGIRELREAGVEFRTGIEVGRDVSLEKLIHEFDAVLIATGTWKTKRLRIPGAELEGVYGALEYIVEYFMAKYGYRPLSSVPALGERVAVIGGGFTAIDACHIAMERGAREIHLVYRRTRREAPAGPNEFEMLEKKGVNIHELVSPKRYVGCDSRVCGVELIRMRLGAPDESGRPRPEPIPGSEFILEVTAVLEAVGLRPTPPFDPETNHGIRLNQDGTIWTDEFFRTTRRKVFAAGDVKHGPSKIGPALKSGIDAAQAIHKFLVGELKGWPGL
nr:FAD-dependent oxidoreductase [Pyrolobus fumarii]